MLRFTCNNATSKALYEDQSGDVRLRPLLPSQLSAEGTEFDSLGCKSQVIEASRVFPACQRSTANAVDRWQAGGCVCGIFPGVAPQATQHHRFAVEIAQASKPRLRVKRSDSPLASIRLCDKFLVLVPFVSNSLVFWLNSKKGF